MTELSEQITIAASGDAVWAAVSDPLAVAACIPGATLTAGDAPGTYAGAIKVKFGPTAVTFTGLVSLAYDDAARRCTIEGRGRDGRGVSNALATGTVTVTGSSPATLTVQGDFQVSGPLEGFARTGGVHLARALLADFARNLEARVAPAEAALAPPPGASVAASGFALLWQALRDWLRGGRGRTQP